MDGPIDLDGFNAPGRVLPVQHSKTEVLVGVGQKNLRCISVPEDTALTLHLVTIEYLHSVKFKKLTVQRRINISGDIRLFLKFIKYKNYITDSDVPNKVFQEFTQYVKKNTNQKGNSVGTSVKNAKASIAWYLGEDKTTEQYHYTRVLRLYLAYFPTFQKSTTKANPSLATIFSDCPYSDTQIIKSLRLVCCWVLFEYDRQREILLDNYEVGAMAKSLKSSCFSTPPVSYASFHSRNTELREECIRLYTPIVETVLESNDPILMERLMQSLKHPFKLVMSLDEMKFFLHELIRKNLKFSEVRYKKKGYQQASIKTLTYRDLIAPSLTEVFSAQCFYASDRVQTSNLERLKLTDISKNDSGIQTEHGKGRRSKRNQKGLTDLYKPGEIIHDALAIYFHITKECQPVLPKKEQGIAFPYVYEKELKSGYLGKSNNPLTRFFNLLITEGTFTQKALYNDITSDEAQPFLWVVAKILQNNNVVKEQNSEYDSLRDVSKKNNVKVKRRDVVSAQSVGLNPTFIGQSRVAMDGVNKTNVRGAGTVSDSSDIKVEAQLTGHSVETKHNEYHDKSNSKEVSESRRTFAVKLGSLMLDDAKKIGELMKRTDVVDFKEAKKLLGCESASEDIKGLLNELEQDVGLTSEIKQGNKTIFVANDLTAALIFLKISHIGNQLPCLLIDDPESQNKALEFASEKVYLQAVLERFPINIQTNGKAMSQTLDFSFADLI